MQETKLRENISSLEIQVRHTVQSSREDFAKLALVQAQALDKQRHLSTTVEEFKSKKEVIKAQYSAERIIKAQLRIK